jgi:hypothetical protein
MGEIMHGAMLLGALACTACTLTAWRHARALDVVASAAMLMAMADTAFTRVIPALLWALVLVAAGIALGARVRAMRARAHAARTVHADHAIRELHRALAFIVGGWLLAGTAGVGGSAATSGVNTHVHVAANGFALAAAAAAALVVLGGWLVARLLRRERREGVHAAEAASLTLMLVAMAVPTALVG